MAEDTLYYTYLDECKRNYLTELMKKENANFDMQEYSITSLTFEKDYYQNDFEKKWSEFRKKYNMDGKKAMHFVEYKKLINPEERNLGNIGYSNFLDDGEFSVEKLKDFFRELKAMLDEANFFIVHTDFIWEKQRYLIKRNKIQNFEFKKPSRNVAPRLLNAVPYVTMRKHLDSLMLSLLKQEYKGKQIPEGLYLDEELPKKIYTKLRFDADGKEFDARTDLKRAYNHTITVGSDNVREKHAVEILDEIRFIRKEEVGHDLIPNHCGLELVDMLCSMISGETRFEEYKKMGLVSDESNLKSGYFINLKFPDEEIIDFKSILDKKLRYKTINYLNY
ncbi:glycine/betaine ABC transporter substrate-binding protein [Enterococcus mundtii]|uniref:glycine/betaine ABC transporter substrate-binding protein n=1 Tax=Enterococcus mundtii TaxID=53346 RepID=UPI0030072130